MRSQFKWVAPVAAVIVWVWLLNLPGCGHCSKHTDPAPFNSAIEATKTAGKAVDSAAGHVDVVVLKAVTAETLGKAVPALPPLLAAIRVEGEAAKKDLQTAGQQIAVLENNQAEIKRYVDDAVAGAAASVASKDTEIALLRESLTKKDRRIASLEDATNNWIMRLCWIAGVALVIGGIVLRVQFPEFARACNGLMLGGVAALVTGTVFRQILLWSKPITIGALLFIAGIVVWLLLSFARKKARSVEELVEGFEAMKKKLTPEQLSEFKEKLQLVTDNATKAAVAHVKAAAKFGSYREGDKRPGWKRLLGIGVPVAK